MKKVLFILLVVVGLVTILITNVISSFGDIKLSVLLENVESLAFGESGGSDGVWVHYICDDGEGYYGTCDPIVGSHCVTVDGDDCEDDSDDSGDDSDSGNEDQKFEPNYCPNHRSGHYWIWISNTLK